MESSRHTYTETGLHTSRNDREEPDRGGNKRHPETRSTTGEDRIEGRISLPQSINGNYKESQAILKYSDTPKPLRNEKTRTHN